MKYLLLTLLVATLLVAHTVAAQTLESLGTDTNALSVTTIPLRPGPSETVTVEIESYATDLDRAFVSWFLNDTLMQEGIGKKRFVFKTGKAGTLSSILIAVKTTEGATIQQTLNIRPGVVNLVWEAVSYTPPFYKGKALYPYQGTVKVVALPNIVSEGGGALSPKNLVYNWSVNDSPAPQASGYGKSVMYFTGGIPARPVEVSVEVSSLDKTYIAAGQTAFAPQSPELLFYEDSPLHGTLYNKALAGAVTLANEEMKLAAMPYFVGARERASTGLSYEWRLNNTLVGAGADKESLTFREEKGAAGTALVSLRVTHPSKIFQFAEAALTLYFGRGAQAGQF